MIFDQFTHKGIMFRLAAFSVFVAMINVGLSFGASPNKTGDTAQSKIHGVFEGDGLGLTIQWENDTPRGEIRRNGKSFPFVGKQTGATIAGTFRNGVVEVKFKATAEGNALMFKSGSRTYKLKRLFDIKSILGTFKHGSDSIFIEKSSGGYKGYVILDGQRSLMTATAEGNGIVGYFTHDGEKNSFSAILEADGMAFASGVESVKMKRVDTPAPGVQAKITIRETLLAKSSKSIDTSILSSPDNTKVVFATRELGRKSLMLWVNGNAWKSKYDGSGFRFSSNSRHLIHRYIDQSAEGFKSFVVTNDIPGDRYDEVIINSQFFSPDGERSIYAARTGKQWRIVVDGKPGPSFDRVDGFHFSPNSNRIAYVGQRKRQWHVVVDKEISPPYEDVVYGRVVISSDGKHVHYTITKGGAQVPILDGKELGAYDAIANVGFSPKGDRFAFVALQGSSRNVIADGVKGASYDGIGRLRFSADGQKFAYNARTNGKSVLVVNDSVIGNPAESMTAPIFSPDGRNVAVVEKIKGKHFVARNGKRSAGYDEVNSLTFSPDGQRFGYIGRQGKQWFAVVDGKASYAFNSSPTLLTFSSDSQHVVYSAKRDGYTYFVVDGTEGKPVWPTIRGSAFIFDAAKRFHTIVRRGDEFVRLDFNIQR